MSVNVAPSTDGAVTVTARAICAIRKEFRKTTGSVVGRLKLGVITPSAARGEGQLTEC